VLTLAEAVHHFIHLFVRAFVCSYSFLGTSPGGLAAQVVTILATELEGGWWRASAWKANWQGGLKRAVYTLLVVWVITLAVCSVTTVYHEHQKISGRWRAVVREKEELKHGQAVRDNYIQQLTKENTRLRAARVPKTSTSAPTVINAPGGIPIVGNRGTVTQPTVNNYGPLPRHLLDQTKKELVDCLKKRPGRFTVGALGGNSEAYKFAQDWLEVFTSAGWQNESKEIPIQIFMIGGGMWSGIQMTVHDASPTEGKIELAADSPEQDFAQCVIGRKDVSDGHIIARKDSPTGAVRLDVSDQIQK
jgi:hypothetical protein